jgi:two-component system NarL family sensor kinase
MCGIAEPNLPDGPMAGEVSLFQQALAERLHDGPLQELVALQLRAANLARLAAEGADDRQARVIELGNLAQAAIEHLQQIIRDLMGDASRPVALFVRLTDLCDQFRAGSGIDCRLLAVPAHVRFEPAVSEVIFRALRELLTNVRKHSQATVVKITSRFRHDGAVSISVSDNGIGLHSVSRRRNPFEGGGFGLWSIEHRLGEFGGGLEIENDPGLRATIVVPRKLLACD